MTIFRQLKEVWFNAPVSLRFLKRQSAIWMAAYFFSGLLIFASFNWQLLEHQEVIKSALLDYFFPKSWQEMSEKLALYLFESQTRQVIGNLILGASLVFASMLLFPLKERFSAEFERDAGYENGESKEFPLSMQAIEEVKLFIFYITAQLVILWIGYYPYGWAKIASIILSYLFLFFTFGLDFIAPTFQRHRLKYSLILKFIFSRPIAAIAFGALYSFPVVLLSHYIFTLESLSLIEISSILFISNLFLLTLAVPAGTHIASQLLPDIRQTPVPVKNRKLYWYSGMIVVLIIMSFLHGRLITSLHHKSQILKADYTVDWGSLKFDLPSLGDFFGGESQTKITFDVVIKNPTPYDIVIENSQVLVEKSEKVIAVVDLDGFDIPSQASRKVTINLDSKMDMSLISEPQSLMEGWRIDLHLELWPGIPFVLNIAE